MMRGFGIAAGLAGLATVAACTAPPAAAPAARTSSPTAAPASTRVGVPLARPHPVPVPPRVNVTKARMKDGSVVTVATFTGPATYVLHAGSLDPALAAARVTAGPAV